jgi:hypothetical protein
LLFGLPDFPGDFIFLEVVELIFVLIIGLGELRLGVFVDCVADILKIV